jgi:hypothetical protein
VRPSQLLRIHGARLADLSGPILPPLLPRVRPALLHCPALQAELTLPLRYDKNKGTSPRNVCVPAYLSSGIFCAVLSTLYAVAVDMSNPFDM